MAFYRAMKSLKTHPESDQLDQIDDLLRVKGIGPFVVKRLHKQEEKALIKEEKQRRQGSKAAKKRPTAKASTTTTKTKTSSAATTPTTTTKTKTQTATEIEIDSEESKKQVQQQKQSTKRPRRPASKAALAIDATIAATVPAGEANRRLLAHTGVGGVLGERRLVVEQCRLLLAQAPIFVDTETSGVASDAEIIEIAAVSHTGDVLLDQLVCPAGECSARALAVSRLSLAELAAAPRWPQLWPSLRSLLRSSPLLGAYNAPFDRRMLRQTNARFGLASDTPPAHAWFCAMQLFARASPHRTQTGRYRRYSLASALALAHADAQRPLAVDLGAAEAESHRALADAQNTRRLFEWIANQDLSVN